MREFLSRLFDAFINLQQRPSSSMASLERSIAAAHHAHTYARRACHRNRGRDAGNRTPLDPGRKDQRPGTTRDRSATRWPRRPCRPGRRGDRNHDHRHRRVGTSSRRFAAEVALARREVDAQRHRLSELDRGRRLARIGNALTTTMHASKTGLDSFSEAEAALAKVTADNHDGRFVQQEFAPPAERLIERLSDAGFGAPSQIRAADILARLRAAAGPEISQLIESKPNP